MNKTEIMNIPISSLAYLGDAAVEVLVRRRIITGAECRHGEHPSAVSLAYVTAQAQSAAVERILPYLTEDETDIFKRGRNCVHSGVPKHATVAEYRRATGLECVFGYLYLTGDGERADELFRLAYPESTGAEE